MYFNFFIFISYIRKYPLMYNSFERLFLLEGVITVAYCTIRYRNRDSFYKIAGFLDGRVPVPLKVIL